MFKLLLLSVASSLGAGDCADVTHELTPLLLEEQDPLILWSLAPLADERAIGPLVQRIRRVQGHEAVSVSVALGLSRQSEALFALRTFSPESFEERLGRALGLLALGDASATATIAAAMREAPQPIRLVTAQALAQMMALRPRTLSYGLMSDPDPEVRLWAAKPHLAYGSDRARTVLWELTQSGRPTTSAQAIEALVEAGHRLGGPLPSSLPIRLRITAWEMRKGDHHSPHVLDQDNSVRAAALAVKARKKEPLKATQFKGLRRLGRLRSEVRGELRMFQALSSHQPVSSLETLEPQMIPGALRVLYGFSTQPAPEKPESSMKLTELLEKWVLRGHLEAEAERQAFGALAHLDAQAALDLARSRLPEAQADQALASIWVVARFGGWGDVSALISVLERPERSVRAAALQAALAICHRR